MNPHKGIDAAQLGSLGYSQYARLPQRLHYLLDKVLPPLFTNQAHIALYHDVPAAVKDASRHTWPVGFRTTIGQCFMRSSMDFCWPVNMSPQHQWPPAPVAHVLHPHPQVSSTLRCDTSGRGACTLQPSQHTVFCCDTIARLAGITGHCYDSRCHLGAPGRSPRAACKLDLQALAARLGLQPCMSLGCNTG